MADLNTVQRTAPVPPGAGEIFLAGGCFWGVEEYLGAIKGVISTDVGYANGTAQAPTYQLVCTGSAGYAEAVRVVYDPSLLPLAKLLEIFFASIDPCSVNRQGHDAGVQYRTGIYHVREADGPVITACLDALAKTLSNPLAIEALPLQNYWLAEEYHQKYLKKNPQGYCHLPQSMFSYAKQANDGNAKGDPDKS